MFGTSVSHWNQLQAKVKTLWRIEGAITATVISLFILPFELTLLRQVKSNPVPTGLLTLGAFLLLLAWNLWLASRSYELYRYKVGDDDLAVAKGVFWRSRRYVSRARIQHVDITAGPIVRALGLVHVSIYVGGQAMAAVSIPGLSAREGERLRDILLRVAEPTPTMPPPPAPGEPSLG